MGIKKANNKQLICMVLAVADRNGASKMFYYFAKALLDEGYRVRTLYGRADSLEETYIPELAALGAEIVKVPILRFPVPPLSYLILARQCRESLAVVGFHQRDRGAALRVAKILGIPGFSSIGNEHHFWGWFSGLKETYYRRCLSSLSDGQLICTSKKIKSELNTRFGIANENLVVLENGIEILPATNPRIKPDRPLIKFITVGRVDYQKGLDVMIEGWARSDASRQGHVLQIVGAETPGNLNTASIKYHQELKQLVKTHNVGDSVHFLGQRNDIDDLLFEADVYLHTARWEGFPLAVLEGMASGLPTIMTNIGATPKGFENGRTGFLIASESPVEVAEAADMMVTRGHAFRRKAGEACRDIVETHHDIKSVGSQFVKIIEQFL